MSSGSGSVTGDVYVLLITFVVGFAIGCAVEYLRERWEERRMWLGKPTEPKDEDSKPGPPWTPV